MSDTLAAAIVQAISAYVGAGLIVAVPLTWFGLPRMDPAARHASWGFKAIVAPGVALFWPLLVARLVAGATEAPLERNAHRRGAARRAR